MLSAATSSKENKGGEYLAQDGGNYLQTPSPGEDYAETEDSLLVVDDVDDVCEGDEGPQESLLPVNLISRLDGCLGAFTSVSVGGKHAAVYIFAEMLSHF